MSEAQAFVALPSLLMGFDQSHYEAGRGMTPPEEGSILCWPEAVQNSLGRYAQSIFISSAISGLRTIRRRPGENEQEYSVRLNNGNCCFRSVQDPNKMITVFIGGLDPTARTIAQR